MRRQTSMPLTEQHTRLALLIDTHVRESLAHGGSDEAIRMAMADDMDTVKQWLETCTDADMDVLCERYNGLHRFTTLLEQVAEGIATGPYPRAGMQGNLCMTADALHALLSWLSLARSVSERAL